MYYSVSAYPNSYIAEANMDGSDVRKFITDVDTPDGLAIDYISKVVLFWRLYKAFPGVCLFIKIKVRPILNVLYQYAIHIWMKIYICVAHQDT